MKQLLIQLILIVVTLGIAARLLISYGQKAQALRRLGLLLFAAFAVWSILDPTVWTRLAQAVGIGRGADLILYGLVVAFFGFVVTTFRRFRDMEIRYTRLARRLALDEARPPRGTTERGRGRHEAEDGAATLDQPSPPLPADPELP
ncbi:hypothetical protein N864_22550 [Intrasporangium chromatireducens Q5-1]|uniref:DUF2304 domain-containing protein n=1 Tax=Intrasporangium chromatireducens Q5-1 TaxID=584657 RepID=W9GMG3_9MICO|nr:DUF2304 domain-containing protein [Intrasporangium chromatireducens]EWT06307.1 hypothetical protein N864_22550 [Intrasporangium chromatireducens Q5-1]